MKKVLLGTTAIIAAAAFGGGAYAQDASEPIKLGLGGYWVGGGAQQIGTGGSANNGRLRQSFQQDSAIFVNGSTKFDNGLSVGVAVGAAFQYTHFNSHDATVPDEHDSSIQLGTHFTF